MTASTGRPVILLTHTPHMRRHYYGEEALSALRALGEVVLHQDDAPLTAGPLVRAASGARIIVSDRMTPGPAEIFAALPDLAAFVRVAMDIRNVDVAAASAAGVLVTRVTPGFVEAVSELILGLMIDLSRGVSRAVCAYQAGKAPVVSVGRQLSGSTLGIIGYGSIGRYLAPLGTVLGMKVLVADPYQPEVAAPARHVTLDALLAESDYVVCLAVATEETENLMGATAFGQMRRGAFFVNASRGNLVDEAALSDALQSGHLGGAAMDVGRAPDQRPSPALARLPGVIATPHIGGLTPECVRHHAMDTVDQVRAILAGQVPAGAANLAGWRRRT